MESMLAQQAFHFATVTAPTFIQEVERQKQEITTLQTQIAEMNTNENLLTQQLDGVLAEKNELMQINDKSTAEINKVRQEMEQYKSLCDAFEKQLTETEKSHKQDIQLLQQQLVDSCRKEVGDRVEKIEKEKEQLAARILQLEYELADRLLSGIEENSKSQENIQVSSEQLQNENNNLKEKLQHFQQHFTSIETAKYQLESCLDEEKRRHKNEIEESKDLLKRAQDEFHQVRDKLKRLKKKMEKKGIEFVQVKRKLKEMEKKYEKLQGLSKAQDQEPDKVENEVNLKVIKIQSPKKRKAKSAEDGRSSKKHKKKERKHSDKTYDGPRSSTENSWETLMVVESLDSDH